jgi:hypothetical protein
VEQEVHRIVYYLDSLDQFDDDRKVEFVVEDNTKKEQHNLMNTVDDIVEDVRELVEAVVVDEKHDELVMTMMMDIEMMEENNVFDNVNHLNYDKNSYWKLSSTLE